ncbi:MAG: thioredoxin [Nanoarchaeota archaeon]|nr:thioredoxin [Nanoarchaeota archaeon]
MVNNDKVPELTNGEFNNFITKGLVLVDFYADWCMPCLMIAPVIEELAERFEGKIKFGKLNVEDNSVLSHKYKVSSIPNLILFKNGEMVERFVGNQSSEDFEKKLKKFI